MRLEGECGSCGRSFTLDQAESFDGCPWCGADLTFGYADFLAWSAAEVLRLGEEFAAAMMRLASMPRNFSLDVAGLLDQIERGIGPDVPAFDVHDMRVAAGKRASS